MKTNCKCLTEIDDRLAEQGTMLPQVTLGGSGIVIYPEPLPGQKKKRGGIGFVLASHCPFCGKAYVK